jgi:hypothetical protein
MLIQDPNNPAARLFNLIEQLSAQPDQPALLMWGAVLVVGQSDTLELLVRVGRVMQLPKLTRDALSEIEPKLAPIYFEWVPQIETAFKSHRLAGAVREFVGPIDKEARRTLRFCADTLSKSLPEKVLPSDDLTRLKREAQELATALRKAEIDPDLKRYAWQHLTEIIRALDDYPFLGIGPLEKAAEQAVGSAIGFGRARAHRLKATDVGLRLFRFVISVLTLMATLDGALQLPSDLHRHLIGPPAARSSTGEHSDEERPAPEAGRYSALTELARRSDTGRDPSS